MLHVLWRRSPGDRDAHPFDSDCRQHILHVCRQNDPQHRRFVCAEGEWCTSCNASVWVLTPGKCKHKVQYLCDVDIKDRDNALACAALVQSSAWEVASRRPDEGIGAVHVSDVVASAKPTPSTETRTSSSGADDRPPPANRFYFEKHVYVGIPRESDMVALKATQRFSSVKPLMVGIPVIGGPPVSTPSSSAVRGCGLCGLLSVFTRSWQCR